jgi:hypothetical protein
MKDLPRFIQLDETRINVDEIVSYGLATDWNDDDEEYRYLFVETKTSEEIFRFDEDDADFDLDDKIAELDELFLIRKLGRVNFQER